MLWLLTCMVHWLYLIMSCTSFRVNSYSIVCLNIKKLFAQSRPISEGLNDSNGIWTHYHVVHKRTLNHLVKLAKWLSCVVSTYLYSALTVCYYHVTYKFQSESTLYSLPECQGTFCLKQVPYLKFKWQQWGTLCRYVWCTLQISTHNTAQSFGQFG